MRDTEEQIQIAGTNVQNLNTRADESDKMFKKLKAKVDQMNAEKADHKHVKEIQDRMNVFEEIESMQIYKNKMLPRIQSFI